MIVRGLVIISTFCSLVFTLALSIYAADNDSGHTGFPVVWGTVILQGVVFFIGALGAWADLRKCGISYGSAVCLSTAVGGIVLALFFHSTCILQEYNFWLHSGQPEPPEHKDVLIGTSVSALGLVVFVVSRMLVKKSPFGLRTQREQVAD